jgi:hypothetical protein
MNSGPPSDASSSGIPIVTNVRRRQVMSPAAPFEDLSTIGQFEYVNYNKVINPLVLKKVRTDALKRLVW